MVSGSWRSGDMAFSWTHVIPLFSAGTSTKSGAAPEARSRGKARDASAAPARRTQSRREKDINRYDIAREKAVCIFATQACAMLIGIGVAAADHADPVVGEGVMAAGRLVARHVARDAVCVRHLAGL